jgi:hypothetical protein
MQRREFLAKSCVVGAASLSGGALWAEGQSGIQRLPNESDAAYRIRLAQMRAAQAAQARAEAQTPRLPGESEAQYRARLAQIRAAQPHIAKRPDESDAAYRTRLAQMRAQLRYYYELRRYEIETEAQKAGFDKFASEAALPALQRLRIGPVGVFYPDEGLSPIYVLLPHMSLESFATLTPRLAEDPEFLEKGADFIDAPATAPAYKSLEVQLMLAFEGMPQVVRPVGARGRVIDMPGRVFQLRTYESPSEKTALKKIEMFNTAEIAIFRKVGLHPVFFGQTLAGTKMPNLTYMLAFEDMEESRANWKKFGADPDWQALRAMPEYADEAILRRKGITNLYLKPASYSQI